MIHNDANVWIKKETDWKIHKVNKVVVIVVVLKVIQVDDFNNPEDFDYENVSGEKQQQEDYWSNVKINKLKIVRD